MKGAVKVVVGIVVVIAAVIAVVFALQYRAQVTRYNDAVGLINDGKPAEGAAALEEFYKTSSGRLHEQAKEDLIKVCHALAADPSKSIKESVKWVSKINEIDPSALTDLEKRMMMSAAKSADMAARAATQPVAAPAPTPAVPAKKDEASSNDDDE